MKRSEINQLIRDTIAFLQERQFYLPPFAFWTLEDWETRIQDGSASEIIENQLGWDITDFARGDFQHYGLVLFTIRNGNLADVASGGKPYAEKVLIQDEQQFVPFHYHYQKMEDIINRGGGTLVVQVYNATADDQLAESPVTVSCDGVQRTVDAGTGIELAPGESITLVPGMYHMFWIKEGTGKVLIGEVSKVNDDRMDNRFLEAITRFAPIEEDETPLHLLYSDYPAYCCR
jgi:hypothetical protein